MDTLLPKIRFKKFKNNWSTEKIENLFTINAGGDIDKDNFSKKKNKNFKYPVYANSHLNEGLYGYSDLFKQEANLITVTGRGSIGKPEVRYTKFYPIIRLLILKPKREISLEFFKNLIYKTNFYIESTGVPQLTAPQISKYKLNFPCLEEQQKIGSFLTSVDDKITLLTKKKELLEQYKIGVMQKIFSQEIRFKDDSGNDFPDWEDVKMGDIIEFLSDFTANGSFASLKENVTYYSSQNHAALVRTTDLEKRQFKPERFTDRRGYDFLKKTSLFGGEIIMANVGSVGNVYRVPNKYNGLMTLAPNTYVLKFKSNINEDFIHQLMTRKNFKKLVLSKVGSSTLKAINKSNLRSINISVPHIEEQQEIAQFLLSLDKKIELINSQTDKTKEFKKGLLQQMFV